MTIGVSKSPPNIRAALRDGATIVIVDEIHKAKATKSDLRRALDGISTKFRIGLTGTPLTNGVVDFHSLVSWAEGE
jgi:SNF2 family DNA or RNA helicase